MWLVKMDACLLFMNCDAMVVLLNYFGKDDCYILLVSLFGSFVFASYFVFSC
jgi:hypothetical protein